ncbi:aminotransferase class I/II-fold pyridoxal phosphate-dependent enzyme [Spongiactinospora sp. TRM90649]|uniref:aminotransferase class I/II-fold pyridoxal phosphate-dependent enzyme n=1 Tax=Spongiactinospora sp. TRM90649 TaxID=3031114 RepID=UPI0023F7FE91|nr:aminotransferase class I/II-fold pyridoxal phosphate-dependent enzyme [Spongiactinospora sp. TRM90649]MDF5752940.1 aminotransferase class I/II-fold pyridoxal phosphate-dependent enzyme [Spongiactinospora sp. TRM90649]
MLSGEVHGVLDGDQDGREGHRRRQRTAARQQSAEEQKRQAVAECGARDALRLASEAGAAKEALHRNAARFRTGMDRAGFSLLAGEHPIVPVLFPDAVTAVAVADELLARGVYVIAFSYPIVPKDSPRIRAPLSAAHTDEDIEEDIEEGIDRCVAAFTEAWTAVRGYRATPAPE